MRPLSQIRRASVTVALMGGLFSIPSASAATSLVKLTGAIEGLVRDGAGIPQMGASVLLFNKQEHLLEKVLTDEHGNFSFAGLLPDLYSVRVTLASFVPAFRNNILVRAGARDWLNINLSGFFSSVELVVPPEGQRALMNEDWKWVLRTSSSTRPVLRLLPVPRDPSMEHRNAAVFSETRGLVRLSGGDGGQVSSFASEADLGTAFAFATSLFGSNQLQVSGNVGYGALSGLPSTAFRTTYSRTTGIPTPEVSVTMRQMFLPGHADPNPGGPMAAGLPPLRTVSASIDQQTALSDSLTLQYGFSLDSVSFLDRLNYFSPYARISCALPDSSRIEFAWTSGNARPDLAGSAETDELRKDLNALSLVPRVSVRGGRAKVQRGEDFELSYARRVGSREFRVSGYHEHVSNAALNMVSPNGIYYSGDLIPDLFSDSYIFDAGEYQSNGLTAAATQKLGEHFDVTVMYASVGALIPGSGELAGGTPDELRGMIRAGRRNEVNTRASGVLPRTGTRLIASYQWGNDRAVTLGHMYSTQAVRPEPGLNVSVRQPIPSFWLPWRMEASADLRNLLAQGYLPLSLSDGRQVLLIQTPRSIRGGVSFIF